LCRYPNGCGCCGQAPVTGYRVRIRLRQAAVQVLWANEDPFSSRAPLPPVVHKTAGSTASLSAKFFRQEEANGKWRVRGWDRFGGERRGTEWPAPLHETTKALARGSFLRSGRLGFPSFLGFPQAETLPIRFQDMDPMSESVQEGSGQPFTSQDFGPLFKGQIRREQ